VESYAKQFKEELDQISNIEIIKAIHKPFRKSSDPNFVSYRKKMERRKLKTR
jgi:hypothetical protein